MELKDIDAIELAKLIYPEETSREGVDLVGLGNRVFGRFLNKTNVIPERPNFILEFLVSRNYCINYYSR